jgi:hypothetical protein
LQTRFDFGIGLLGTKETAKEITHSEPFKKNASKHPKLPKPIFNLKAFNLKVKNNIPIPPKIPIFTNGKI